MNGSNFFGSLSGNHCRWQIEWNATEEQIASFNGRNLGVGLNLTMDWHRPPSPAELREFRQWVETTLRTERLPT
jgi:hypothetical protein